MIRILNVSITGRVLLLMITEAILLCSCYLAGAFVAPLYDPVDIYLLDGGGLTHILLVVVMIILGLYLSDLYGRVRHTSGLVLIQQLCLILGSTFLFQALLGYTKLNMQMPRWMMVTGSCLALILIPLWRWQYWHFVRKSLPTRKLLFLGTSATSRKIMDRLANLELDMTVVGYTDTDKVDEPSKANFLGPVQDLKTIIEQHLPDSIVVSMHDDRGHHLPIQQLMELRFSGIAIEDAASTYEQVFRRVSTDDLRTHQMVLAGHFAPPRWNMVFQHAYSYVIGLIGLIIAAPIMVFVAILVRLTSEGPVLFRQKRVGLNGETFSLYKFRSMRVDAEAKTGPVWAQKNDPRVTSIGGWLRRTRLDELPQLFNVLRGEMAVVGPRPERPEFVSILSEKIPFYNMRHTVKPGITGWAQVNHKYGDTIEDTHIKLEYDLYYIKNVTMALDTLILFQTVKIILLLRGSQ